MSATETVQKGDEEVTWQEQAEIIRRHEDEDGTLPATVTDWDVCDGVAEITYTIPGLGRNITTEMDAKIQSGEQSQFEMFLQKLGSGYTVSNADLIREERPEARARAEWDDELSFSLVVENNMRGSQRNTDTEWAESEFADTVMASLVGFTPILNFLLFSLFLNMIMREQKMSMSKHEFCAVSLGCMITAPTYVYLISQGVIPL